MKSGTVVAVLLTITALAAAIYFGRYSGEIALKPTGAAAAGTDADVAPSPNPPWPKVVVDEQEHFFGSTPVGEERSHSFVVRNEGEAPLRVKYLSSTCKCTVSDLKANQVKEVPPGETFDVKLSWTPESESAEFRQVAHFKTNDPNQQSLELVVFGQVEPYLVLSPAGEWNAGAVSDKEPSVVKGRIGSNLIENFQVEEVRSSDPRIKAEVSPVDPQLLEDLGVEAGYEITVTIPPDVPVGPLDETLTIRTDVEQASELTVPIRAQRRGPISFLATPGVRWIESEYAIALGRFEAADGKKAVLRASVDRMPDEPVKLTDVDAEPPYIQASLEPHQLSSGGNGWYNFVVSIPPGSPPATRSGSDAATIRVKTNHPEISELTFRVGFTSH